MQEYLLSGSRHNSGFVLVYSYYKITSLKRAGLLFGQKGYFCFMSSFMHKLEEYMLPCINKQLLGTDCMGCGIQRSLVLLFKGELVQAFYMYPAIYTLLLLFAIVAINIFKPSKLTGKLIVILAITNVVIIIVSFIIKNYIN
jgi:hypothetical protein